MSALSWDAGLVPYRDLPDFDFPGPIYLCYLLGKTFGWGDTTPFNAIDTAFLVVLGIALAAWSRRLFGSMLPGLVGYLPFLGRNGLSMDITHVGQRDWHGPFFVILGLLAQQARPGRGGRIAAALALAAGLAYRPQLVLLLPATVLGVVAGAHRPGEPWDRAIRPLGEWAVAFAGSLVLVFGPLIVHGVLDDFVLRLNVTRYGGTYNQATWQSFIMSLETGLAEPLTLAVLSTGALLSCAGPPTVRGPARTWLLATIMLVPTPISPVQHVYLHQPLHLIRSIALALPVAWLLATPRLVAPLRLAAVAAVIIVAPRYPAYCSITRSLRALAPLAGGQSPVDVPAGCRQYFGSPGGPDLHYRWDDYRRVLAYLRDEIPPWTASPVSFEPIRIPRSRVPPVT